MAARSRAAGAGTATADPLVLHAAAEALANVGSWALDLANGQAFWSDQFYRILGLEPQSGDTGLDTFRAFVHPEDRGRVDAVLDLVVQRPEEVPAAGIALEFRLLRGDGTVREVRARGRIEQDALGVPIRWIGSTQDVTEERLTQRELQAHYAVHQALRDWETFDEGVVDLLRRLGTALDFPMGSLWIAGEPRSRIVCRAFWRVPTAESAEFETLVRRIDLRPGEDKPGVAWREQRPVVTPDIAGDPSFGFAAAAARVGLATAIAFPAVGPAGTVAVLSFYSFDHRPPGPHLVRTLTTIGGELGRFLEPRRGELEPRRLTERELEVLRLTAEGNTGPEIAERLALSPSTVKTHFEHVYEKLGVGDRAAAVAQALRSGLIH